MRVFCCVCGREKIAGQWSETFVEKKDQCKTPSHGYCKLCFAEAKEKLLEEVSRDE